MVNNILDKFGVGHRREILLPQVRDQDDTPTRKVFISHSDPALAGEGSLKTLVKNEKQIILLFLIPAMLLPGIASLFYFVWFKESLIAQWTYVGVKVFSIAWPLFGLYFMKNMSKRVVGHVPLTDSFLRPQGRGRLPWYKNNAMTGLGVGIFILTFIIGLTYTPLMHMIQSNSESIRQKSIQLGFYQNFIPFAIFLSLIHSLIEEYYWRWFVYGWSRKIMNIRWAILLSSLAFGFHHFVITIQYFSMGWGILFGFAVVLGGAIWCYMYEKQQSLLGAWISHIFADVGIMWVGYQILFSQGGHS